MLAQAQQQYVDGKLENTPISEVSDVVQALPIRD